jgi:hypothetical protein
MRNYFKARLDYIDRLGMDNSAFKFIAQNSNLKGLTTLIQACGDWPKYVQLFHSMKLTGMAIEATPQVLADNYECRGTPLLGLLTAGDQTDFNTLAESKGCITLNYTNTKRKYISFNGSNTGWISTDNLSALDGKIFAETNSLASGGNFIWNVKFSFYITFKNPN